MSLQKDGYKGALHGTTKFKTHIDRDGNIVIDDTQTVAGRKTLTLTRTNAENSASDNLLVMRTLAGFVDATIIDETNTFDVKWEV